MNRVTEITELPNADRGFRCDPRFLICRATFVKAYLSTECYYLLGLMDRARMCERHAIPAESLTLCLPVDHIGGNNSR